MKRNVFRFAALFLCALFCAAALEPFAYAADADDPSRLPLPYYFEDDNRLLSFDAYSGILTVSGTGNHIHDEGAFWKYIYQIAPFATTVKLKKDTVLRNRDANDSDCYLFEKALSALYRLTAFQVESGSETYAERGGVLYDSTITVLIHYPAGKTDDAYHLESNCMEIRPFAFCNTQHLRKIFFNYTHVLLPMPSALARVVSDGSRRHFMILREFALGNIDLSNSEAKESTIQTIYWYGKASELREIAAKHQGNNIVFDAQISEQSTGIFQDISLFYKRMMFVTGLSRESSKTKTDDWKEQIDEAYHMIIHNMGF